MYPHTVCLSVAATAVTPMLGDIVLFGVFFAVTLVIFTAAMTRQTIITALLSCVLWFALGFAVWNFGDATSALTQGSSIAFVGLGVVMLVVSIHFTFEKLREAAEEKRRRIAEEVM